MDPEWHGRVEEELAQYRRHARRSPLKLRGVTVTGKPNAIFIEPQRLEDEHGLQETEQGKHYHVPISLKNINRLVLRT